MSNEDDMRFLFEDCLVPIVETTPTKKENTPELSQNSVEEKGEEKGEEDLDLKTSIKKLKEVARSDAEPSRAIHLLKQVSDKVTNGTSAKRIKSIKKSLKKLRKRYDGAVPQVESYCQVGLCFIFNLSFNQHVHI